MNDNRSDDMMGDGDRGADVGSSSSCSSNGSCKICESCSDCLSSNSPDQVLEIVLENVLQFLTSRRDRNAASLVCKAWYHVEALTRSEIFIGNCYAVSPRRVTERFRRARAVVIKGKPRFADFGLMPSNWGAHFKQWAVPLTDAYPYLEKLCLKRMSISDNDLWELARSLPGLKELALVCCDGFSTAGLAHITSKCRQLRVLDLIDDELLDADDDDGVDWLSCFPDTGSCLESLIFDCVEKPVNFDALEKLVAHSPSLKKLGLNQHISIGQLRRLMLCAPQLTHLGTGSFVNPNLGQGDQGLDLYTAFAACKSLIYLSGFRAVDIAPNCLFTISPIFWVLDSVRDEGLQAVAATCKDLRELRVFPLNFEEDGEAFVSEAGLVAISEGCRKLCSLLYFCRQMTNAAVVTMSKNCRELVVFRLCIIGRHCPDHLTGEPMDEGFGAIVMNCKKLRRLAVSGLLTDKAFAYIGKYGKLVRTLSVAFAGNTDMGLRYVLEGCPKLQKLEIRDSPFGDEALLSGVHHFYNMRFLWMSSCKLSLSGCMELARKLPHLVVEVIKDNDDEENDSYVERLYMYRSLAEPRNDAPHFVSIL